MPSLMFANNRTAAYSKWIIEGGASRGAYGKFADTLIARIGRDAAVQVRKGGVGGTLH